MSYQFGVQDFLNSLFNDEQIDAESLPIEYYQKPLVLFFGQVPEEREEFIVTVDEEFIDYFEENLEFIFKEIGNSISYRLQDEDNLLSDNQIRLIDHIYGVMHQIRANRTDKDHVLGDLGLLTIESEISFYDDLMFIGDKVFSEHSPMMEKVGHDTMKMKILNMANEYEFSSRVLFDIPNVCYYSEDIGFHYPATNNDFKFSGQLGLWRIEQVSDLIVNADCFDRQECESVFKQHLITVEKAMVMFENVLDKNEVRKVRELVQKTKDIYEVE